MKVKKSKPETGNLVIHDLTQVSPDRHRKDVGTLRNALENAESITIPNRRLLYDLYHDVLTIDAHLSGIIEKRIDAVLNKNLRFLDNSKRKVDAMDNLIYTNKFRENIRQVMLSVMWGISGVEYIVGKEFDFVEIPRKHIRPEKNIICRSQYDYQGIDIAGLPMVRLFGKANDLGKLLQCSLYALYKRSGFGDFAQYVEIYGQPVRLIYYDAHDTRTRDELRKILNESGSSLAMMIPRQAQFEMLDGKNSNGNGDLQINLINACNAEMSIGILGNSETTLSSRSSGYAQAKEHSKQQLEITKSDLAYVQNCLNEKSFLEILQSYGYPVENGYFEFEREYDLDDLTKRMEIDKVVSEKVPVGDDYWYDTYGVPKPSNYAELKKQQEGHEYRYQEPGQEQEKKESPGKEEKPDVIIEKKDKNLLDRIKSFFFGTHRPVSLSEMYGSAGWQLADDMDSMYEEIARMILSGQLTGGSIHPGMYFHTAERLASAINEGLNGTTFNYDDSKNILRSYLTRNIYSFSAAKTLTQLLQFRNLMYDKDTGEIVLYNEYLHRIRQLGIQFNQVWLATEYDTALQSAIMAHKWDSMQAEYLEYSTAHDHRVRPDHAILDGKTYPKNHPFWNKYYPPLDWNCRCTVIPGIERKYRPDEGFDFTRSVQVNDLFSNNVGKTRLIFKKDHPYYINAFNKVRELTFKQYGLKPADMVRAKKGLPGYRETDLNQFSRWWDSQQKYKDDDIAVRDILGNEVLFESRGSNTRYFRGHILKKSAEKREQYATNFPDVIKHPHEIWDDDNMTFYLKFYRQKTIVVVVDNKSLKGLSMYDVSNQRAEQLRKGLLKYKGNRYD